MLKGKILTMENLKKRGINGPSRCPNCCNTKETMHHLFVECPFAIDCWKRRSTTSNLPWNPQQSIAEAIYNWRKCCPWKEKRSNLVRRVWNTLPYTLLWRIWLAKNQIFFQDKSSATRIICNKAKILALETISVKTIGNIYATKYSVEERDFISYILEKNYNAQKGSMKEAQSRVEISSWKIRLKEEEFANWIQNCNCFYLFFRWGIQVKSRHSWSRGTDHQR